MAAQIPADQCFNKVYNLWKKEDPSTWAYGVYGSSNAPCNLKTNSKGPGIKNEPIDIVYDRQEGTVKFTSKNFDLYQTGLPKDVDFCLAVTLWKSPQEVELEILNLM